MIDTKRLRELAKRATKGPWYTGVQAFSNLFTVLSSADNIHHVDRVATCGREDAAFIAAASPSVIISLLDRLEAAKRERDELCYLHEQIVKHVVPGVCDSVEAMLKIVRERDELKDIIGAGCPRPECDFVRGVIAERDWLRATLEG